DLTQADPAKSVFDVDCKSGVWAISVSPDDARIATGHDDGSIILWERSRERGMVKRTTLRNHTQPVAALAFRNSRWLVSGDWEGAARIWDLSADTVHQSGVALRARLVSQRGAGDYLNLAVAFGPGENYLTTLSVEGDACFARRWFLDMKELVQQ